jgi:hypothetical protein
VGDLLKSFHALASFSDSQFKTVDSHLTSSDYESSASIRSVALTYLRVIERQLICPATNPLLVFGSYHCIV